MTPQITRLYQLMAVAADLQDWPRVDSIARMIAALTKRYALANKD